MSSNEQLANYFARRPKADDGEITRFVKFYGGEDGDVTEVINTKNKLRRQVEES